MKNLISELIAFEGVLNDDRFLVNRVKGRTALVYYTYANEWGNHEHVKQFKTLSNACKWYKQNMLDRAILQGAYWLTEDGGEEYKHLKELIDKDYGTAIEQMTEQEKQDAINEWENMTLYCEL